MICGERGTFPWGRADEDSVGSGSWLVNAKSSVIVGIFDGIVIGRVVIAAGRVVEIVVGRAAERVVSMVAAEDPAADTVTTVVARVVCTDCCVAVAEGANVDSLVCRDMKRKVKAIRTTTQLPKQHHSTAQQ